MTQVEYLAILFDDCGYSATQRRGWLDLRFGAQFTDELTRWQCSQAIAMLKDEKESQ